MKTRGTSKDEKINTSQQLAYMAQEVENTFLSKWTCQDLGIIGEKFSQVNEFPLGENKKEIHSPNRNQ